MRRCLPPLAAVLALACSSPIVYVGEGIDPQAVPLTWQEHWYEHDQVLAMVDTDEAVAQYYEKQD